MKKNSKIYVAGHRGLVGSAMVRKLMASGYENLVVRTREELDLMGQERVEEFFEEERPEYVFLAAAKVGGILANSQFPAKAKKLLFLGSSCIYPKHCPQPMKEEHLLSGYLEPSNEPYAVAKIAGIKMCQSYNRQYGTRFISVMPTNLYGPGDNFDLKTSHVLPALIRKFHEGKMGDDKSVEVWGTGTPRREFLYVDDLADACLYLMNNYDEVNIINVGVGKDQSIRELAEMVGKVVGFKGDLRFDHTKPDGTPLKLLDVSKLTALGWRADTPLKEGIRRAYQWYLEQL